MLDNLVMHRIPLVRLGLICNPIRTIAYLALCLVFGSSIAFAQQGVTPPRPLTHDLMKDLLGGLDAKINSVHLTELKEGVFYSVIKLEGGRDVSARPSDAIALALRTGAPILGSEELLNEAGIEIPDESEDEVERFKEFLEGINPEDFQA